MKLATRATTATRPSRTTRGVVCQASADKLKLAAATFAATAGLLVGSADAAGVKFAGVSNGATVASPVHVDFLVDGMEVKPAAEGIIPNTGHFHVIVDTKAPAEGEAIPFDDAHLHYGKGQTSADLNLPAGKHTLVLQFANAKHESYGSKFASTITVNVK